MTAEFLDACPECGGTWSAETEDGRKVYPALGGNIANDRVTSWHCLICRASWERGDRSIYKPATVEAERERRRSPSSESQSGSRV